MFSLKTWQGTAAVTRGPLISVFNNQSLSFFENKHISGVISFLSFCWMICTLCPNFSAANDVCKRYAEKGKMCFVFWRKLQTVADIQNIFRMYRGWQGCHVKNTSKHTHTHTHARTHTHIGHSPSSWMQIQNTRKLLYSIS